ncbi:ribonuclease [Actinobacillus minor]|uniref:ribonuclease T2 family protein n=1 Tax=Actinobacillus minor TaxID=51047 RepID=UPI0026E9C5A1|nr:ribonuclease [Actinobacillus minor]
MKLSKTTLNIIILIFAALISYFFGSKEKEKSITPATQTQTTVQTQPTTQTTTSSPKTTVITSSAKETDYDAVMAEDNIGQNATAPVHYYMLALSWSPSFCETQKQKNGGYVPQRLSYQCAGNQNFGWVIHGLWPQNKNARSVNEQPRYCQGDLAPLSPQLLEKYLPESPGMTLLQGQWEKHGACAFNNAEEYFAKQKALFQSLTLPNTDMRKNELFRWMRKNNPQLDRVYLGASKNELYICYDKSWQPMDCPQSH